MMRILGLLRHGKSSWADPHLDDFDRPLKSRGRKAAIAIGKELQRRGLSFDLVLASPARRVVETIDFLEKGVGHGFETRFDDEIYGASHGRLLELVRQSNDKAKRLLVVGHHPGLQQLALSLALRDDRLREGVARHYPTAALVLLDMPANGWRGLETGTCRIIDYLQPRELSPG